MADGRGKSEWAHTSTIATVMANCHRNPKKPAFKPADFNPYLRTAAKQPGPKPKVSIDVLRQILVPEAEIT